MEIKFTDRAQLKEYFRKNKIPREGDFGEFIDATLNQREDGLAKLPGDPLSIEAIGDKEGVQRLLNFYRKFSDTEPAWSFNFNDKTADGTLQKGFSIGSQGSSRFFIQDVTGNTGIGTTRPAGRLQVMNKSEDANGSTLVLGSAPGSHLRLGYHDNYSWIQSHGAKPLALNPLGQNVGVGTSAPNGRLHILSASETADGLPLVIGPTNTSHLRLGYHNDYSWIQSHGAKPLALNPLGQNIGIGTTAPNARLHIMSASEDAGGYPLVIGPVNGSNLRLGYHTDYSWVQSHGSKPLALNPVGNNVGIGTTKPEKRFHLERGELRVRAAHNDYYAADIGAFYAENLTQGIGIGYCRIAAIGSNANQDIELLPKGLGLLRFWANNGATGSASFQVETNIHWIGTTYAFSPHAAGHGSLGTPTKYWRNIYCHDLFRNYEYQTSDRRIKENIVPIAGALDKIRRMTGYRYDIKQEFSTDEYRKNNLGLMAQEVEKVLPESVRYLETDDRYFINYSSIIPVLVEAVKQLATKVDELQAKKKA